ncbi:MAG: glycoside hydrolase family 97 protein, partial [Calditrichaeota bacterium]|nr:glycoside hydrolase family 97 protein [Calditrichota bacterium]
MVRPIITAFILILLLLACDNSSLSKWELLSPNGNIRLVVKLANLNKPGYPADKVRLYYRVEFGKKIILPFSPLGIRRRDQDFIDGLQFVSASGVSTIDESYKLAHGKRSECRNHANEITLNFKNSQAAGLQLVFRAYDDGVAFRYRFPERNDSLFTVKQELSGFRMPEGTTTFIAPHEEASLYEPSYESCFENGIPAGTPSPTKAGWHFPALFKIKGGKYWALLTEAGLDDSYCGSHLEGNPSHNIYRIRFPEADEGNGTGDVYPKWTLPWATPWRVIIVGNSLATIVESSLVTNLGAPSVVKDSGWIRPGRVSWSWWSDNDSPMNRKKLEHFIDLAAEMGWEYSLVDANWNEMAKGSIEKLVRYADGKNVSLILWYNSGGPHNKVMIFPRDRMNERTRRRKEFEWLQKIGVRGVKVDFWQSDKQNIIQLYLDVLRDAADFHLMVNFHGCTIPRGW